MIKKFLLMDVFYLAYKYRHLIFELTKKDIKNLNQGSIAGLLWVYLNPILILCIYGFVFGVLFKSKWPQYNGISKIDFALILFSGMLVYSIFSDGLLHASTLIRDNEVYVKKILFPLEILPLVTLLRLIFNFFCGYLVWLIAYFIITGGTSIFVLLIPLIISPYFLIVLGFIYFTSSLSVYFKDLKQIINLLNSGLLFLSPVFYPPSIFPEEYQFIIKLNPLSLPIEDFRFLFMGAGDFNYKFNFWYSVVSLIMLAIGYRIFGILKRGFADVL